MDEREDYRKLLSAKKEQEFLILSILAEAGEPVGSGAISDGLRATGAGISEATAGRILRELDNQGLTQRDGFRGRSLTEAGYKRFEELRSDRDRANSGQEFISLLKVRRCEELVDILVARRAIERETARLAAIHARDAELDYLEQIVSEHKKHAQHGVAAEDDVNFHRLVARMSGNKVLQAAVDLIRQDGQLAPVLEYIRKQVKSKISVDHSRIVEALRRRDAAAAEKAMVDHIENLIRDVRKYWSRVQPANPAG